VKANIVAPILRRPNELIALICANALGTRKWQAEEIRHAQLAIQIGYALDQASVKSKQRAESAAEAESCLSKNDDNKEKISKRSCSACW
jgi:GAF domain-containing protein